MRLTDNQASVIKAAAERRFGRDTAVYLFGSRVDDSKRGGDIDLYLETTEKSGDAVLDHVLAMNADIQCALGEQRVDIVVHEAGQPLRDIDVSARRNRVRL